MIGIIVDMENKEAIMTTPNMSDTSVKLLKYLPYGLDIGDKPRYEVLIEGTDVVYWPWKSRIKGGGINE